MERGDTGPGRDAYGQAGRRRWGDRRIHGLPDDAEGAGASGVTSPEDAPGDYGQLLRRPGELPPDQQRIRQLDRPRTPQPVRIPPPAGHPASSLHPNRLPPNGRGNGGPGMGGPANGGPGMGGPANGAPGMGGPANGGPMPGRQYRLPNDRRIVPDADRPYRPAGPGPADGNRSRPSQAQAPAHISDQDPLGGIRAPGRQAQAPGTPPPAALGTQASRAGRGAAVSPEPAGPVIRQRETAVPDERPADTAPSVASIAPDGLEAFARDLRVLRARAELDYPEMAELSHFTMKTLASAAGGLRLPTLPVAVAYVRACGGNVAEWEERWQKLATKITADAAKKRRSDGEGQQVPPEPADPPASPEPLPVAAAQDQGPDPGEVYVITSAKPRQPDW